MKAVFTDELYHLGKIIELHLNSRMCDNSENRNLRIIELINEIKAWNKDNFYFNQIGDEKIDEYYCEIIKTLKNIYYGACFHEEEAERLRKSYEDAQNSNSFQRCYVVKIANPHLKKKERRKEREKEEVKKTLLL